MSNIQITIPNDNDNYIEYVCPFCGKTFRLETNEYNNDSLSCVYCGLNDNGQKFIPVMVREYFSEYVSYCAKKEMDKSLSKLNSKSKFISIKYTPSKIEEPQIPSLSSKEFTIISCKCDKNIKVEDSIEVAHYCPYCKEII